MLPNKPKATVSGEIGTGVFSHMVRHMPCLLVAILPFVDNHSLQ